MAEPKKQLEQSLTFIGTKQRLPERLITHVVGPFLAVEDLCVLSSTCKSFHPQYKKTQDNKTDKQDNKTDKEVAAKMLHCVLHPNEANFVEFSNLFTTHRSDLLGLPFYLIRNDGVEVYVNEAGEQKIKTKRLNTNVLEAIIRTRNFHCAEILFKNIPKRDKTRSLKQYIKEISALPMWGMLEYMAACQNFLDTWDLSIGYDWDNWIDLDRLSGLIGQSLKEHLPWFSICLFCNPGTHANADYTKAPNWVCILINNKKLDLDLFGADSICALYKGASPARNPRIGVAGEASVMCTADLEAFKKQIKVLSSKLNNTIKQFELDDSKPLVAAKPARG